MYLKKEKDFLQYILEIKGNQWWIYSTYNFSDYICLPVERQSIATIIRGANYHWF
jgi:hypothetical protein